MTPPTATNPEQPARDIEDHRKSYGRYGGRYGEFEIGVMRRHAQILHEVVDPADVDGQRDAERHGDHDEQCIDGPCDTHLHVVIQHVAYKINQRDAGDDEKSAGHQRMPRRIGMENGMERSGQCERRYERGNPCQQR